MKINVDIDSAVLLKRLRNGEKRMAFAVVNALNNTAKKIQEAERQHARSTFHLRPTNPPNLIEKNVAIIKPFASVGRGVPYVEISVGQKKRLLLSQFERGGVRTPARGKASAVPIIGGPARPSFDNPVPAPFTFKGLKIVKKRGGVGAKKGRGRSTRESADVKISAVRSRAGAIQFKGEHRTFLLTRSKSAPEGGVFQRVGPKRDDIRLIYSFVSNERIPALLEFLQTARGVSDRYLREFLQREVVAVLARHAGEV